ncbi:hypothetical protein Bca4012_067543 [Brassica carinata]
MIVLPTKKELAVALLRRRRRFSPPSSARREAISPSFSLVVTSSLGSVNCWNQCTTTSNGQSGMFSGSMRGLFHGTTKTAITNWPWMVFSPSPSLDTSATQPRETTSDGQSHRRGDQRRPIPPIATQPKMAQPQEPHFFQPLLPGFQTYLTIPIVFFSKHIQGKTNENTWTLTSDATDQTWQVIQEERRLTRGWKEFTEAHDLRIGDIVIFKLEGSMVFHVTPFGPSCCDIQYTYPNSMEEAHDH